LDKYGEHPMAVYARLVKGFNSAREFKTIKTDYKVQVRKPQYDEAEELLSAVIDASEAQAGVDNITLNMTMQRMANVQFSANKKKEARATMKRMVDIFESKSLNSNVLSLIKEQVAEIRSKF
jgi:predicted negative regulator of RcsB-dependent stress response